MGVVVAHDLARACAIRDKWKVHCEGTRFERTHVFALDVIEAMHRAVRIPGVPLLDPDDRQTTL